MDKDVQKILIDLAHMIHDLTLDIEDKKTDFTEFREEIDEFVGSIKNLAL